jgi:hypothetical protein
MNPTINIIIRNFNAENHQLLEECDCLLDGD